MTNDKDAPPFSSTSNAPSNASVVPPSPEIIETGVTAMATTAEEVCNDSNHAQVRMEAKDPLLSSSVAVDPNEDPHEQPQPQQQQKKEQEDRKPFSTFQNKFQKEEIDVETKGDLWGQHKEESFFQKDNNDNRDGDDDDDVSMNSTSDHSWNDEHISIADTEEVHNEDVDHHHHHHHQEEEYPKESTEFDSNHQFGDFCDQDLLSQSDDSEFKNCQDIDNDDNVDIENDHDHDLVSENNSHHNDDERIHNEYNNEYTYNHPSHDKDDPKDNHDDDFPTETNSLHEEEEEEEEEEHETLDQDATQNGLPSTPLRHLNINMDSISLTKNDHETWFHHHLSNGFDHICKEWKLPSSVILDTSTSSTTTTLDQPIHHHHHNLQQQQHQLLQEPNILINIIDPTTPPPGSVSSTPEHSPSRHMKRRAWNRDKINQNTTTPKPKLRELNIFEKLDAALDRQCDKTLRSVRYRNLRTGEMESIDSLPIRMELRAKMMTDAVEWHNGPICHVYIAACCSVEHYREKVRPSLRVFVSQMEGMGSGNVREGIYGGGSGGSGSGGGSSGAGGGNNSSSKDPQKAMAMAAANRAVAAAKDMTGGSSGAKYMIVFVPIHPSTVDGEGSKIKAVSQVDEAYKGGGIGLRGRIAAAAAARRNNHGNSSDVRSMTNTGGGNEDTVMSLAEDGMTVSTSLSSSTATTSAAMLSKEHREIHKKFLADFPNGKICVLSTLLDSDHNLVPENPVQKQELHTFCQDLGKTVLMGFVDRIQRYNEELKRCEIEPGKGGGSPSRRKKLEAIDWKHYFLIKESAAITYEQMRLPMEALYQYDEIEAKLPMNAFLEGERKICQDAVRSIATTGCTESFRGIVKSTKNMADIQHLVSMYILGRQVQLLFLQKLPRAAINKCLAYVKKIYKLRCEQAIDLDVTESQNVRLQNEIWAASACWDLKMASEAISSRLIQLMKKKKSNEMHSPPSSPERRAKAQRVSGINEKALLRSMCDVLNYARKRLLKICEVIFPPDALIRRAMEECPSEAFEEWQPLEFFNEMDLETVATENVLPLISPDSWQNDCYNQYLLKSLESDKAFEELYIEISHHLIQMYELLERNRTMSRMLAELAEIHILRGDLDAAAEKLLTSIENFSFDPWDTLLAWRVFRLACCQRKQQQSKAPEYLKSLTCCLGSRLAKVIPNKFRHLLTLDLKTLVGRDNVSEYRWDLSPLFETRVSLKDTSGGKTTFPFNESSVELHSCRVGDDVEVEVALNSSLAEQIEVDELKITMLRLENYETIMNSNADVTKSQGAIVLTSGNAITINPGNNTFPFSWSTISADKFVVGSVCLQWRKAAFHQDFITSSNVMVGLEVLPAEYTQSIKLDPDYVIPGHVQDINIHFHSGSDFVTGGRVQISCSKGLKVMNPKELEDPVLKEWQGSCDFSLDPCLPNSDITLTACVKSEPLQRRDPNIPHQNSDETESTLTLPSLKVEVITSYHHGSRTELFTESKPIESPSFTIILEAAIATLECEILTIKTLGFYPLNSEMFIISATVQCQIPIRFNLTDWNISLPSSIVLDTDGDLNVGICNQPVTKNDEICFGFRCKRSKAINIVSQSNHQVILAITLSDDIGRSFQHEMPIDITGLDEYLSLEETSSDELITDINLSLSSLEGLIGSPITFNYDIDCNSLQQKMSSSSQSSSSSPGTRRILYQLSTSGTDWIVGGGNVKGTLSTSSGSITTRLSFIAVPTRVGIIANFPTLHLSVLSDQESGKTLAVRQKNPKAFVSMNQINVKTMAFVL